MRLAALIILLAASPLPARADTPRPDPGIEIVAHGVFGELETEGRVQASGSSSGSVGAVAATEHAAPREVTDRVTAEPGVRFGFTFVAKNLGTFDSVPIEVRVTHPPLTLPDGRVQSVDSWPADAQGIPRFTGWLFEHDYELVPGDWTLAVLHDGKVAAEKTFRVALPPGGQGPARDGAGGTPR